MYDVTYWPASPDHPLIAGPHLETLPSRFNSGQNLANLTTRLLSLDMDIDDILREIDPTSHSVPDETRDLQALTRAWIAERSAPELLEYVAPLLPSLSPLFSSSSLLPPPAAHCGPPAHAPRGRRWPAGGLFERVNARIKEQIGTVEDMTGDMDPKTNFALIVIQTELERYKYLVRSYLRARITKVSSGCREADGESHVSSFADSRGGRGTGGSAPRSPVGARQIDKHTLHYLSTDALRARLSEVELAYATRHQALLHNHYLSSFLASFPAALQNLNDTAGNTSMVDAPDLDAAVFIRLLEDAVVEGRGVDADGAMDGRENDIVILRWSDAKPLVAAGRAELV